MLDFVSILINFYGSPRVPISDASVVVSIVLRDMQILDFVINSPKIPNFPSIFRR